MATYKKGSSGSAVKEIQKPLNKTLKPSPGLDEDGQFGDLTHNAVVKLQTGKGLKPDGVVGPDTMALLEGSPAPAAAAGGAASPPADAHTSRASFVDSRVKENAVATKIIDQIYRFFPKNYKVISAYLSTSDLYWKVNYHWDALRTWLEYAKDRPEMSAEERQQLNEFYRTLMSNAPSRQGHYKIDKIGEPEDSSPPTKIEQRCKTLQKMKLELKRYAQSQGFNSRNLRHKEVLRYALNPLALPKKSNHVHGWALDIAGGTAGAAEIATKLGATLAYPEETHCHCEFAGGVKLPR
jgi:peptidoglycan hydrolase-like protein with peptidoglycan-binding domain